MSAQHATATGRNVGRSILAILAGIAVNVVIAIAIDEAFHAAGVYPSKPPMAEAGDNALALSYRLLLGIGGAYVTARLAPSRPMRHALILGGIGTALSILGVIVAMQVYLGPLWYPLSLAVLTLPCAWLGGRLAKRD